MKQCTIKIETSQKTNLYLTNPDVQGLDRKVLDSPTTYLREIMIGSAVVWHDSGEVEHNKGTYYDNQNL